MNCNNKKKYLKKIAMRNKKNWPMMTLLILNKNCNKNKSPAKNRKI